MEIRLTMVKVLPKTIQFPTRRMRTISVPAIRSEGKGMDVRYSKMASTSIIR